MANNYAECGVKLSFRDSFVYKDRDVCRDCLQRLEKFGKIEKISRAKTRAIREKIFPCFIHNMTFWSLTAGVSAAILRKATAKIIGNSLDIFTEDSYENITKKREIPLKKITKRDSARKKETNRRSTK